MGTEGPTRGPGPGVLMPSQPNSNSGLASIGDLTLTTGTTRGSSGLSGEPAGHLITWPFHFYLQ